jgi:pseudouridine-5'-phosphate glycosidase
MNLDRYIAKAGASRLLNSLSFLLWVVAAHTAAALDLTPIHSERELEGFRIPMITFTDAAKKVSYQPPSGWTFSGEGSRVSLYPSASPQASMQLRILPKQPVPASANGTSTEEEILKLVESHLPPAAEEQTATGTNVSPFMLGPLPSKEFLHEYKAQGRRFSQSTSVVELNAKARMLVIISARAEDFKEVREAAIASLFSWSWE